MPKIDLHREVFYYASVGDGLRFVFQHGMGADTTQPLGFGGDLRGGRTIAMDCRGHGHTEASLARARISFAQFSHDLAALLDVLRIERAVIGGISMGAALAVAFGLAHPERVAGLILVRPAWLDRPFPPNLRWFPIAARLLQEYPTDEAARRFQEMPESAELRAASQPAADSLLGQFHRPVLASEPEFLQICPRVFPSPASLNASGCRFQCKSSSTPTIQCIPTLSASNWPLPSLAPHSLGSLQRQNPKSCTGMILPASSTILSGHLESSLVAEGSAEGCSKMAERKKSALRQFVAAMSSSPRVVLSAMGCRGGLLQRSIVVALSACD
jgi:pimeloyl-ACP methyl ester carboxylesterase